MLGGSPSWPSEPPASMDASIVHELSNLEVPPDRGRGVDPDLGKLLEEVEALGVPEILNLKFS